MYDLIRQPSVLKPQASSSSQVPQKHQAGSFQNAVGVIASETYRDEEGYSTTYNAYRTSPLGQALSEQYTSSSHKNSCSERAALMARSYREATSRILITANSGIPSTPVAIAKNLLNQIQAPEAEYKAQQMLQQLTVLSLTQAGFNLHEAPKTPGTQFNLIEKTKKGDATPPMIGVQGGYNGEKGWLARKEISPKKVKEYVEFLNTFKHEGQPTLRQNIAASTTFEEHAEQLVYHGTMLLICTPAETLRTHAERVKQLANIVNDLETTGKSGEPFSKEQVMQAHAIVASARSKFLTA